MVIITDEIFVGKTPMLVKVFGNMSETLNVSSGSRTSSSTMLSMNFITVIPGLILPVDRFI